MRNSTPLLFLFIMAFMLISTEIGYTQDNTIRLYTDGQQFGVADLDCIWISNSPSEDSVYFERDFEECDSSSVGKVIWRSNAKNVQVWGQFGTTEDDDYPKQSGSVYFFNIPGTGTKYVKIRYSKHSEASVPIQIFVNDKKQGEFIPKNQQSWNKFSETGWIKIKKQ